MCSVLPILLFPLHYDSALHYSTDLAPKTKEISVSQVTMEKLT